MPEKQVKHHYLLSGIMHQCADTWHAECAKPSMWEGPYLLLTDEGVTPIGTVKGCVDCEDWEWTNSKTGEVRKIAARIT
jgi:hypothetical protein